MEVITSKVECSQSQTNFLSKLTVARFSLRLKKMMDLSSYKITLLTNAKAFEEWKKDKES